MLFFGVTAFAQGGLSDAFGITMGTKLENLSEYKPVQVEPGVYYLSSAPKPNSFFDEYRVILSPSYGVCKVMAFTPTKNVDAAGEALQKEFHELESTLKGVFGNFSNFDFLKVGSKREKPGDWMISLAEGDRNLASVWNRPEKSIMPPTLSILALQAQAENASEGYMLLTYEFNNFQDCIKEIGE